MHSGENDEATPNEGTTRPNGEVIRPRGAVP
jgi:hypothetical protein